MASGITADTSRYCFLDLDLGHHREKLAMAAAFVDATDSRYGFTSNDLRLLGGSEIARVKDLIATDHEWSQKANAIGVETRPPVGGNRIIVELYWDIAPMACENFATLCANGSVLPFSKDKKAKPAPTGASGKPLTYRGSIMHRCVPDFVLQGGDFVKENGSGGESIFKKNFKDEKAGLNLKHDERYVLSMGNSGKNSNSSQFFFTFKPSPQLDGKHVVFGRAISGFEVIDSAEKLGTKDGEPTAPIVITDCGIYNPLDSPGAGYWYDSPDPVSFSGISPIFMVLPRVAIVAPNQAVLGKFEETMGASALLTPILADEYSDEAAQSSRLQEILNNFAIDVVVVAPVCRSVISELILPTSWQEKNMKTDDVVIEAKPVDAITAIHSQTWLSRQSWRLEGLLS